MRGHCVNIPSMC